MTGHMGTPYCCVWSEFAVRTVEDAEEKLDVDVDRIKSVWQSEKARRKRDEEEIELVEAGLELLTAGFDEYLEAKAQGLPTPDLTYRFDWSGIAVSNSNPTDPDVDFKWEGKVKFTLVGLVKVDVPDPWK